MPSKPARKTGRKSPARTTRPERTEWSPADALDGADVHLDPIDGTAHVEPVAVSRLTPEARVEVYRLAMLTTRRRELEEDITHQVTHLREHGISWNVIGFGLGTSGQAAAQRYGS